MLDEEDKEVIIERLYSNPLFNCETPFKRLLVHPSVHTSVHPSVFLSVCNAQKNTFRPLLARGSENLNIGKKFRFWS